MKNNVILVDDYFSFYIYNKVMIDKIAVSACLLGVNCKYNGNNNYNSKIQELIKDKRVYVICPEVFSGLTTPRIPSEIKEGKVINMEGRDVTPFFESGKEKTLAFLKENGVNKVILKDGSPSCGYSFIYDGTFSHKKVNGMGICAEYLIKNGIEVVLIDEN